MDNEFIGFLPTFLDETVPVVEMLDRRLRRLEQSWTQADPLRAMLPEIKRQLHTIRGNSGMLGLTPLEDTGHVLENLCAEVINRRRECRVDVARTLIEGVGLLADYLRTLREVADSAALALDPAPAEAFCARVRARPPPP